MKKALIGALAILVALSSAAAPAQAAKPMRGEHATKRAECLQQAQLQRFGEAVCRAQPLHEGRAWRDRKIRRRSGPTGSRRGGLASEAPAWTSPPSPSVPIAIGAAHPNPRRARARPLGPR